MRTRSAHVDVDSPRRRPPTKTWHDLASDDHPTSTQPITTDAKRTRPQRGWTTHLAHLMPSSPLFIDMMDANA